MRCFSATTGSHGSWGGRILGKATSGKSYGPAVQPFDYGGRAGAKNRLTPHRIHIAPHRSRNPHVDGLPALADRMVARGDHNTNPVGTTRRKCNGRGDDVMQGHGLGGGGSRSCVQGLTFPRALRRGICTYIFLGVHP